MDLPFLFAGKQPYCGTPSAASFGPSLVPVVIYAFASAYLFSPVEKRADIVYRLFLVTL
jgi:hypothetical protein